MTVAGSPAIPVTVPATVATPFSIAGGSEDQTSRQSARSEDGERDAVSVPPAPQQWPRVFPGL